MDGQTIRTLIQFCADLVAILQNFASIVLDYVTTPIRDLTPPLWLGGGVFNYIIRNTPLGDTTLFSIMLGGGISLYLIIQLWKWLKEIVL